MELTDLLLKKWGEEVKPSDVIACNEQVKEVLVVNIKSLIYPDFVVGRCRVWTDDESVIKFIVIEQSDGKELRVDSEPPLDTSDWPKRVKRWKPQDPW